MSAPSPLRPKYCFSVFEVDPRAGELRRNGVRLRIQDQPLQILVKLLERPSEIVTREELKAALWRSDTFVDFDNGLNMAVKRLREVLADDADRPVFIETVPRKGYRFIAPLNINGPQALLAPKNASEGRRFAMPRMAWRIVAVVLLTTNVGLVIRLLRHDRSKASSAPIEMLPLAGLSGFETQPAFAPDGSHVAFVLHASENSGIYTAMVGGEKSLRLTSNSADCCPRWSPDGRQVLFSRLSDGGGVVVEAVQSRQSQEMFLYVERKTGDTHYET